MIKYILKDFLHCIIRKVPISHTDEYKGFKYYKSYPKKERKNIIICFFELRKLSKYYHCFPDTYCRFNMFLKSYGSNFGKMKSFVPQVYYGKYIAKKTEYDILINDKSLFSEIMNFYKLPHPKLFFKLKFGNFYSEDNKMISDKEVNSILNSITDKKIFVKKYRGGAASGVSILTKFKDGFYDNANEKMSAQLLKIKFKNNIYIFQQQIYQEPILKSFNPDTVNTIRVLVYNNNGKFNIIAATVRFGRKNGFVDNFSKGGIAVSLNINTGRLGKFGVREYEKGKFYKHPDSNIEFDNVYVDQWDDAKKLVYETMGYLSYYRSVGFDIATSINGPVIIEINTGAGIYLSQMGRDKGLLEKFID